MVPTTAQQSGIKPSGQVEFLENVNHVAVDNFLPIDENLVTVSGEDQVEVSVGRADVS